MCLCEADDSMTTHVPIVCDSLCCAGPPVQEPVATTSNDEEDDRVDALEQAARSVLSQNGQLDLASAACSKFASCIQLVMGFYYCLCVF